MGAAVHGIELRDAERAGWDAIATPIADIVLDDDTAELSADNRSSWAGIKATGVHAMLANVAEHEPGDAVGGRTFDKCDMPPGRGPEVNRIVVAESSQIEQTRRRVTGKLIPLLTCNLACLAADANRGVGQESISRTSL
jgi:hypothetical protein